MPFGADRLGSDGVGIEAEVIPAGSPDALNDPSPPGAGSGHRDLGGRPRGPYKPPMRIAGTTLDVFPWCLGGNVFGWTADERASFEVLDAWVEAGGNFIDTADAYSAWAPGNSGGESETILGRWMAERRNRDRLVLATKVGKAPGLKGLGASTIRAAAGASLARLGTDRIDLYYAHADDPDTPLEETLRAFDGLVREGKGRHLGASNFRPHRVAEALAISKREGLARFVAIQDHYNLVRRDVYEGALAELCTRERLAFLPYYALAQGFLTGKYRRAADGGASAPVDGPRAKGAASYADERGWRVLAEVEAIAAAHSTSASAVALAWLFTRPNVVAPIASARSPEQARELVPMATFRLTDAEVARLTRAGA